MIQGNGREQQRDDHADGSKRNQAQLDLAAGQKAGQRTAQANSQSDDAHDDAGMQLVPGRVARLAVHVDGSAHERHHEREEGDAQHRQCQRLGAQQNLQIGPQRLEQVGGERPARIGRWHALDEQAGRRSNHRQDYQDDADHVLVMAELK